MINTKDVHSLELWNKIYKKKLKLCYFIRIWYSNDAWHSTEGNYKIGVSHQIVIYDDKYFRFNEECLSYMLNI